MAHNPTPPNVEVEQPSLRRGVRVWFTCVAITTALLATVLVVATTFIHHALRDVVRDSHSQALVDQAQLSLLVYQRLSNLYVVTQDRQLDRERNLVMEEVEDLLLRAKESSGSAQETQLLETAQEQLKVYGRARAALEASKPDPGKILHRPLPELTALLGTLNIVHDLNEEQVEVAQTRAMQVNRLADWVGGLTMTGLMVVLGVVSRRVNRHIVKPLLAFYDAMTRFHAGDLRARIPEAGIGEIKVLGHQFNNLVSRLARQREEQLTFLAGVAHDLRNPLNALKLGLHGLSREQSTAQRTRTHTMLDRQLDRLTRMIEDLLDATRIEAGELELRPERVDLRDSVNDMVRLYAPTAPDHHIDVSLPHTPVWTIADPLRIEQVISNLLSNAVKFSPRGSSIEVALEREGDSAVITVRDHGIGMSKTDVEEAFLPFRRRRPEAAPGAGLGLSVVRRIVEGHGGHLGVESTLGEGSTFRVYLACTQDDTREDPRLDEPWQARPLVG